MYDKLVELYKRYTNYVVILLLGLVCLKSCKSCALERRLDWDTEQYINELDSVIGINDSLKSVIKHKSDTIIYQRMKLDQQQSDIDKLNDWNGHLRRSNNDLIKLKRSETAPEKDIK